jgi:hypothetical protein
MVTPTYFPVTGSSIHVEEVPSGTTGAAILDATYPVAGGTYNTVMIVGEEANGSLAAVALVDDRSAPPAGQIKLRIVNGASTIGPVDLYVNSVGDVFPSAPTVPNLDFKGSTAYLPLDAANFHVCMMPAGTPPSSGVFIGGQPNCSLNLTVDVSAGYRNFTFAVFDNQAPPNGGGGPGQFIAGNRFTLLMDLRQ